MKTTTNVFLDGITTDLHPLTTKNNLLTDALNATLRTFNGNELVLQNDMGNTMIQDSTTGNIMGLRDGFVPVGMKEYGGILYIASYNLKTGEGQLGTIPSPVFNYSYKDPETTDLDLDIADIDTVGDGNSLLDGVPYYKYYKEPIKVSTTRLLPGDQFLVVLDLSVLPIILRKYISGTTVTASLTGSLIGLRPRGIKTFKYNLITGFSDGDIPNYGLLKFVLEAKTEKSSSTIPIDTESKRQQYYVEEDLDIINSDYWFINSKEIVQTTIDSERCLADNCYRTYPNILPGYLYVRVKPELPYDFNFILNASTGLRSPNVFVITE